MGPLSSTSKTQNVVKGEKRPTTGSNQRPGRRVGHVRRSHAFHRARLFARSSCQGRRRTSLHWHWHHASRLLVRARLHYTSEPGQQAKTISQKRNGWRDWLVGEPENWSTLGY